MNVPSSRNQRNDFSSLKLVNIVILVLPKREHIFLPILCEEIQNSVDIYVLEFFPTQHPHWDQKASRLLEMVEKWGRMVGWLQD
jgi:hypothetical protein